MQQQCPCSRVSNWLEGYDASALTDYALGSGLPDLPRDCAIRIHSFLHTHRAALTIEDGNSTPVVALNVKGSRNTITQSEAGPLEAEPASSCCGPLVGAIKKTKLSKNIAGFIQRLKRNRSKKNDAIVCRTMVVNNPRIYSGWRQARVRPPLQGPEYRPGPARPAWAASNSRGSFPFLSRASAPSDTSTTNLATTTTTAGGRR